MSQNAQSKLATLPIEIRNQCRARFEHAYLLAKRWIADTKHCFDPTRTCRDGATVHEDVEAGSSSVRAIAALTDAAKRERRDVQGGVIDSGAAGACGCKDCS